MKSCAKTALKCIGMAMLLTASLGVRAAELNVVAGVAFAPALKELGPQFERATGHRLAVQYGILAELKQRLASGEAFDVAIVSASLLEGAAKQGKVAGGTRKTLVRVGMAVAVRAGSPKPDIGSVDAFKRALLSASSVTYPPEAAIGLHLAKVLGELGIAEQINAKTLPQKSVESMASALATGKAELGFGPSTVFPGRAGVEVVGPFPPALQDYLLLAAGTGAASAQPDAAKALIQHLTTPDAVAVYRAKGFEPSLDK
jgi:molybdate transport system substrate-binding protein